jgi:D-3-phosphoglycerate dehydrogenase
VARIAITDCDFGDGEIETMLLGEDFEVSLHQAKTRDEVIAAGEGAVGLFVQWARIDSEVLDALPSVKAIVRYGIGLDNIDLEAARARGVSVSNVDDYCINEVALHAASCVVAANRGLWQFDRAVRDGGWAPGLAPTPRPPHEDPVGVVGMGRIGRVVARLLSDWGYPIYFWDPVLGDADIPSGAHRVSSLAELAHIVNHLTLHVPLLDSTRHIVGEDVLNLLGGDGHLINVSRGGLVDEESLLKALEQGALGGASLDVLAEEPPPSGSSSSRLAQHPRVLVTPHVAYLSTEALQTLRVHAAKRMLELLP